MIFLFYGTDVQKTRTKAFDWIAAAKKKEPNLAYVRLAREELTPSALEDAAHSGGLFINRLLILIDDPFPPSRKSEEENLPGTEDSGAVFEEYVGALADSDNAVVVLAPKLPAAKAKKLAAKAKMAYRYDLRETHVLERGFNTGLVNALASRSREKLWLEINRALRAGDAPEMLHGLLHWKARDLLEKGSRAWSHAESRRLSLALIELLQKSRRKNMDLSDSLERFALSI